MFRRGDGSLSNIIFVSKRKKKKNYSRIGGRGRLNSIVITKFKKSKSTINYCCFSAANVRVIQTIMKVLGINWLRFECGKCENDATNY